MSADCTHDLDPEYLYAGDVDVLEVSGGDGDLRIRLALPCPECDRALELETTVDSVEESDLTLPIDADEVYD